MSENKMVLLYAEVTRDGYLHTVLFELANKAQELSAKLNNAPIIALLITKPGMVEIFKEGFINSGFDKVYVVEDERLGEYSNEFYSKVACDVINEIDPYIVLIGATCQGRDLAPRISSSINTGLTADCTGLDINEKELLAATRPTFGGQLMATILCKKYPQMATVRPRVFKPMAENIVKNTEFIYKKAAIDGIEKKVELIEFNKKIDSLINELDSAEVIVSGGRGMKNTDGFKLLDELAKYFNGCVGASRGAVDMGIAPHEKQIGQTGKTVTPKLYIACGISGATQHTVGITGADKIAAINTDPNAPIFNVSDVGIVGDALTIIPELIELLKGKNNE